jgi:ABC-type transport system substrate-binding protein
VLRRVALGVREQLARVGIHLELRFVKPFAPFYGALAEGPPCFLSKWLWPDALDAVIGFASSRCRPFPNWQHASVPELDEAFREWLRAGTREELRAAAARAQRIAAERLPYVPLLAPNDVWVVSRRVRGYRPFPANLYPFYQDVSLAA